MTLNSCRARCPLEVRLRNFVRPAQMPYVSIYDYLLSKGNPYADKLNDSYRALEARMRQNNCQACHAPDNQGNSAQLEFFAERVEPTGNGAEKALFGFHVGRDGTKQRRLCLVGAVRPAEALDGGVGLPARFQQVVDAQTAVLRRQIGMIGTARAAGWFRAAATRGDRRGRAHRASPDRGANLCAALESA